MYKAPTENHIVANAYAVTTEGRIVKRLVPPGGEAKLYWDELFLVVEELDVLTGRCGHYLHDGEEADEDHQQVIELYEFQQRFKDQVARSQYFGLTLKEFVGYVVSSLD